MVTGGSATRRTHARKPLASCSGDPTVPTLARVTKEIGVRRPHQGFNATLGPLLRQTIYIATSVRAVYA